MNGGEFHGIRVTIFTGAASSLGLLTVRFLTADGGNAQV
jgi:hypothetical protein